MQEEGEQQTHTELPKARDAQKKEKRKKYSGNGTICPGMLLDTR